MNPSTTTQLQGPALTTAWPYLTATELTQCFAADELDELKAFAHRTSRDYITATRLLFGEKRLIALKAVLREAAGGAKPRSEARSLASILDGRWKVLTR